MRTAVPIVVWALVGFLFTPAACFSAPPEWGTLKGRVVFEGEIPKLKPLVEKGALNVKDAVCCAAQDIPDEKYVIDLETNGFANVVIYLPRRPAKVHPDLEKLEKNENIADGGKDKVQKADEVKLELKGCQFLPHILVARTGQKIRVLNQDSVAHNFHSNPVKNNAANIIIPPMDPNGVLVPPIAVAERLPFKIACDIHPWMSAYCVALDHPYFAITDKTGSYEIKNLPRGKHEFAIWHESTGYVERNYTVTIEKEMNEQQPYTVEIQ